MCSHLNPEDPSTQTRFTPGVRPSDTHGTHRGPRRNLLQGRTHSVSVSPLPTVVLRRNPRSLVGELPGSCVFHESATGRDVGRSGSSEEITGVRVGKDGSVAPEGPLVVGTDRPDGGREYTWTFVFCRSIPVSTLVSTSSFLWAVPDPTLPPPTPPSRSGLPP